MSRILFYFFVAVSIVLSACSKGGEAEQDLHILDFTDSTIPVIVIKNPTDNQVFKSGETIIVDGKVTDNSLYEGSIRITDDASNAVLKEQKYEIHGFQSYDFHIEFKTLVTAAANYTITVKYEDHGLNPAAVSVKVKVNP